jgi:hypothetical protein
MGAVLRGGLTEDAAAAMRLAEPEDGHQGLIDAPLLLRAHPPHEFTKPSCVDGADLLNQDTGGLTKQLDLGAERCRFGAARRWRDQDHRARQEFVDLNDHAVASALLLATGPARKAEFVHVTP